jgi:PPOX class probable F420-dependent enzyme
VDIERAVEFLRGHHRAILATTRSDGRPQLSPVLTAVDDQGLVLISTRETAVKTRNLARDPRASLCVLNDGFFGEWIQAEGTTQIIHLPEALELLEYYYRTSPASTRTGLSTAPPCSASAGSSSGSPSPGRVPMLAAELPA